MGCCNFTASRSSSIAGCNRLERVRSGYGKAVLDICGVRTLSEGGGGEVGVRTGDCDPAPELGNVDRDPGATMRQIPACDAIYTAVK